MLELSLLRHAKSDWDAPHGHDRDRPLNERGVRSARAIGEYVASAGRVPDIALTSPAVRARTTVELASSTGRWPTVIEVVPELYSGGPDHLLEAIMRVTGATNLMIVGHEPTMSSTVSRLLGGGSYRVATATLVEFRFPLLDWSALRWGIGELRSFTLARDLVRAGFGNDPTT